MYISSQVDTNCTWRLVIYYCCGQTSKTTGKTLLLSLYTLIFHLFAHKPISLKIEISSRFNIHISAQVDANCTQQFVVYHCCGQTSKSAREKLLLSLYTPTFHPFAYKPISLKIEIFRDFMSITRRRPKQTTRSDSQYAFAADRHQKPRGKRFY